LLNNDPEMSKGFKRKYLNLNTDINFDKLIAVIRGCILRRRFLLITLLHAGRFTSYSYEMKIFVLKKGF